MQAPFTPDITNGEIYASNMREPTIIRAAVSRDLCEVAATELKNAVAVGEQGSYTKYEPTPACADIARKAHRVSLAHLISKTKTECSSRTTHRT